MPWGRMDDKFHRNRKVRDLRRLKGGHEALGRWVYWWSWCLDDPGLTGLVPCGELTAADLRSAELLVSVGLWDRVGDDFQFHDFATYNPSREQLEKKKDADRARIAAARAAEKDKGRKNVASDNCATEQATSDDVANDNPESSSGVAAESQPRDAHASAPAPAPAGSHPGPIPSHPVPNSSAVPKPPVKLVPTEPRTVHTDSDDPPVEKRARFSWAYGRDMASHGIAFQSMGAPFAVEAFDELARFCEAQSIIEKHGNWDEVAGTLLHAYFESPEAESAQWNLKHLQVNHRRIYMATAGFRERVRQLG